MNALRYWKCVEVMPFTQGHTQQRNHHPTAAPVGHRDNLVSSDEPRLHDVHVLATNGVVQPKQLLVVLRHLQLVELIHRSAPLMRDVVDDKHAARVGHLVVVPVVRLQVEWKQRCVPVVGDEDEIVVSVWHAATWDVPGCLQCSLGVVAGVMATTHCTLATTHCTFTNV